MENQRRKLCLVIPSLHAGGMERVISELSHFFASKSYLSIYLILYGKNPSVFYELPRNINLYRPHYFFNDRFRWWFTIRALLFLRKQMIRIKPDAILSFGEYWNSFVLLTLFGLNYPVFISDRCQPDKKYNIFHNFLRQWLYPRATGIIAQTIMAKEIYVNKSGQLNITVIGNPIRDLKPTLPIAHENIILTVGRLISTKHHDRLIRIFSKLDAQDWSLVIIGGDALKQKNSETLSCLIKNLNLSERVFLKGELSDVTPYYRSSKIFAFTSSSEGFPNVVGEALSAGLPVVAYDCIAGPSEMISDRENGFLVPVFDDELFRQRLQLLIDDEELRQKMSAKAPASVEKYSLEKIGQQYLDFILS